MSNNRKTAKRQRRNRRKTKQARRQRRPTAPGASVTVQTVGHHITVDEVADILARSTGPIEVVMFDDDPTEYIE